MKKHNRRYKDSVFVDLFGEFFTKTRFPIAYTDILSEQI